MGTEVSFSDFTNETVNGSSRIPWDFNEKVVIVISYSTSIGLSTIGNALVIIVFWVGSFRPNRNNEVRQFLTNLAVSDLLISLFCLPFTFTYILLWDWPFPYIFCPIVLSIQLLSVTASSITNMVIGLDRFWVVIYPMKSRITRRKSGWVIGCIWIGSIMFCSVQCFVSSAHVTSDGYTECSEKWTYNLLQISYTISILMITYILPLCVLTVTYSIVGIKLWRRSLPGEADQMRDAKHMKSKIKVIKMLSVIVICFGICWMPLHLFFVEAHISQFQGYTKLRNVIYVVCHWVAMSNSFVNPVVYSFMNDSFKTDFRWLFFQKCCRIFHGNFKSSKSLYLSTSSRSSVSNHFSGTYSIHKQKQNRKKQIKDHSSSEKVNEVKCLFQKNDEDICNNTSFDSQYRMLLTLEDQKPRTLIVDNQCRGIRGYEYYQIITQL